MHIFENNFLTKEFMESFYKRNYGSALVMVNMNTRLTYLAKDKLDSPYWELIANKRQHTHLFRSFLLFAEGMCS
jgi:hypothetical protein